MENENVKTENLNLTIEEQYQLYLKRMKLSEATMHPQQKIQVRDAFYGAFGQMLILMKDVIVELPDDEGDNVLTQMMEDVRVHWEKRLAEFKAKGGK